MQIFCVSSQLTPGPFCKPPCHGIVAEQHGPCVVTSFCVVFPLSCCLRCIDLSLFNHRTTSHNAGHFLRLILSPCLVIRDNCQLSQGTIRSITAKSMHPLGLYRFLSSSKTTTWNVKRLVNSKRLVKCLNYYVFFFLPPV